ncbi:unnamed protein product [Boreogadus saida]
MGGQAPTLGPLDDPEPTGRRSMRTVNALRGSFRWTEKPSHLRRDVKMRGTTSVGHWMRLCDGWWMRWWMAWVPWWRSGTSSESWG